MLQLSKHDTSQNRLMQMLSSAIGPQIAALLEDPNVAELMLNPDGSLWVDRLGEGRSDTGYKTTPTNAERVIYLVASSTGAICSAEQPVLSAEFPGSGNRFQGLLPPVVANPVFTIRKKALMVFTLENYVEQGIMTSVQQKVITQAVHEKRNILIVGGTGTGKTTLANAILDEIANTGDRIIIIEDTLELQCTAPDTVFLRSREHVPMNELLKATMRLRPDRIVVGEVRGPEALTLLKAWNTGHPGGCATVHANNARGGLTRLEQLISEASITPQKELIAEAIHVVIFIERYRHGRRIKEIAMVDGIQHDNYVLHPI